MMPLVTMANGSALPVVSPSLTQLPASADIREMAQHARAVRRPARDIRVLVRRAIKIAPRHPQLVHFIPLDLALCGYGVDAVQARRVQTEDLALDVVGDHWI